MDSIKSDGTLAGDAKIKSDLFKLVENLRIELQEKDDELQVKDQDLQKKDKELAKETQEKQKLSADLGLEKTRTVEETHGKDELKIKLAIANKTISAFEMALWKLFPSSHICYHIKAPSGNGEYAYLNDNGYLCSSTADLKGHFKFEKDSDGTFLIYSSNAKYLQIKTSCTSAASLTFSASVDNKSKFALIFHPQKDKHQPSIVVDIYSLANGCFLSIEVIQHTQIVTSNPWGKRPRYTEKIVQQNQLVANSPTAPSNKFLILASQRMWHDVEMN